MTIPSSRPFFRNLTALCLCIGLYLIPSTGNSGTSNFQSAIWPEHLPLVQQAKSRLQDWHDSADLADAEAEALELLKQVLAAPPKVIKGAALVGNWRVRSLQGGTYGLFLYPYFKSNIRAEGENRYWFEKTTGSQRRSGHLYPESDKQWVFLGATTVNDEPQGIYRAKTAPGPAPNDSVGVLWQINSNHLVMLLDVASDRFEIYELRR